MITLAFEQCRRIRDSQIQVMSMLLNTRHMPADPAYTAYFVADKWRSNTRRSIIEEGGTEGDDQYRSIGKWVSECLR